MIIDTHAHIDGSEFDEDREAVLQRAREAGVGAIFVPAIDLPSSQAVLSLSRRGVFYTPSTPSSSPSSSSSSPSSSPSSPAVPRLCPMVGLHPEEVRDDWRSQLSSIHHLLEADPSPVIAIGEVGLDYYWSRDYEHEQLEAFEEQVQWSIETRLPLMIHCRKAQNEMVRLLRNYEKDLPGGVFHCFTGNEKEAAELLQFDRFVLGIGGVLTFKKSHLPETLNTVVPLDRIVLETDAPYMAPVPMRGKRNESAFVVHVMRKLAESYGVTEQQVADSTNAAVQRVFGFKI